jgi:uncharacterized protein DUF3617
MRLWIVLFALTAGPAWADIEPGNWEITATTSLPGIKEPTTFTQTRCLSAEEARDPSRLFGPSAGARCQFTNRHDSGSVFTFAINCGGQPPFQGSGSVRYARESLEGEVELKADDFVTRSRIAGRRLGGC